MKRSEQYRHADMAALADVLSQVTSSDLTTQEVTALKTELAKPAYAGKTSAERVGILMTQVLVDNPDAGEVLDHQSCSVGEFLQFILPYWLPEATAPQQYWAEIVRNKLAPRSQSARVRWDDPDFVPMREAATTPGSPVYLFAESALEVVMPPILAPEKIWQTPCEVVLGDLAVVTLGDVLRAEA